MHETLRLSYVPEPESTPQANQYHSDDYKRQEHVLCLDKKYRNNHSSYRIFHIYYDLYINKQELTHSIEGFIISKHLDLGQKKKEGLKGYHNKMAKKN